MKIPLCLLISLLLRFSVSTAADASILQRLFNEELTSSEQDKLLSETKAPLFKSEKFVEHHFLISFNSHPVKNEIMDALKAAKMPMDSSFQIHHTYSLIPAIAVTMNTKSVDIFRRLPQVKYVEYDSIFSIVDQRIPCLTQNDAKWCLSRCANSAVNAPYVYRYDLLGGLGVTIYVIDTGVNSSHVDLKNRATQAKTFVSGEANADLNGHGTAVASVAAGTQAGVAKRANIVGVKVLDQQGSGTVSNIIAGIAWAAGQSPKGIINLSLGGGKSQTMNDAVTSAFNSGSFVVVAAGNNNVDACTISPASTPVAYTVAASDINNALASFSDFGSCVDLIAPGVNCFVADAKNLNGFTTLSGTSFSSPYVAGWAAVESPLNLLSPQALTARLNSKLKNGVIQVGNSGTPNKFIHVTC